MKAFAPALMLSAALCVGGALAQDHLVPIPSVIGGSEFVARYQDMVRTVLHEAFDNDIKARLIVEPSFEAESAVAIRNDGDAWRIVTLAPSVDLWAYIGAQEEAATEDECRKAGRANCAEPEADKLRASLPPSHHDVKVARCEIAIDPALGAGLLSLWQAMLLRTRFTRPGEDGALITDGTLYYFSAFGESDFLAGSAHSPDSDSTPGALVAIADTMAKYCHRRDDAPLADLKRESRALQARLDEGGGK